MCDELEGNTCVGALGSIHTGYCRPAGVFSGRAHRSCTKHECACVQGEGGNPEGEGALPSEPRWMRVGWDTLNLRASHPPRRQEVQMGCGAWLLSFLLKTQFPPFVYELRGGVYQSWKMPQRGSDQRQTLKCVLRWISLPNTLMWLKHKFHRQLFSICLVIIMAMLCAINGGLLLPRSTKWI